MLSLRIALRYLVARKRHTAVNVISLISLCGVAVATAAIVVVLSVFNGFADLGHAQASAVDPDILLTPCQGKVISHADSLHQRLLSYEGIAAVAEVVDERGLLISANSQVPVRFKGIPSDYNQVVDMQPLVTEGVFYPDSMLGLPSANIALGVAYHGGIVPTTDRTVSLYVPRRHGRVNPANPLTAFRSDTLLVWSVLRSDMQEFDTDRVLIPLATARQLLDYTTEATAIELATVPGTDVRKLTKQLREDFPQLTVADRMQQQSEAYRMIAVEKWVTFMMLVFILIIASFNVVSTLSLLVMDKSADMEVMASMGASRAMIRRIFEWQGSLICIAGGIIGAILGTTLTLWQQYCHVIKLNADSAALTIDYYPIRLAPADLLMVLGAIIIISLLVGLSTRLFKSKS